MKTFGDVWRRAKENLYVKINPIAAGMWINSIEPVRLEGGTAVFSCPSEFHRGIVADRYRGEIKEALGSILGFEVELSFVLASDESEAAKPPAAKKEGSDQLPARYTFDTFIVGSGNKFAHAASVAVVSRPAEAFNPLFIYGESGLGKTHLMCAIGNEIRKTHPKSRVIYVKSEDFTNELIAAVREGRTMEFKNKYRMADVLLMDDIQFIGGKLSTEEEFFHTFNTLYTANKQIVLTSDRPPKEIATLEDRLRTRFESGLLADIQPPDYEMRCAIITAKAESLGFNLPQEVVDYLGGRLKSNIRQLEGAVQKIRAHYLLDRRVIDKELAAEAIRDVVSESEPVTVTIDRIIKEVGRFYNLSAEDIKGEKRNGKIVNARQVAMFVIREITELSLPLIGEIFSNRNHTTVLHSIRKVEQDMQENYKLKSEVSDFIKNLKS